MMRKDLVPSKCTPCGEYKCQVPMPLKGRRQDVDICIADLVAALNAANIKTEASCCGHGKIVGTILLEDGRCLNVFPTYESWDEYELPKADLRLR